MHPPPLQAGLILPLRWNVLQKFSVYLYSLVCGCSTWLSVHVYEFFFSVKGKNIILFRMEQPPVAKQSRMDSGRVNQSTVYGKWLVPYNRPAYTCKTM